MTDRQLPTPDQVNSRQNFNKVSNNYALIKKVMFRNMLAWGGGIIGAAAITTLIVLNQQPVRPSVQAQAPAQQKETAEKNTACILPPLPAAQVPFTSFKIAAADGATLHYPTGTSIEIPADAFVSATGHSISDSITIRYREFHNPLDIFLSGIPMNYDSAGTKYTLESAGMLEIRAFDGDRPLALNTNKPVTIRMASGNADPDFNLYQLDTTIRNWVCKGKDKISPAAPLNSAAAKKTVKAASAEQNSSIPPALSDPGKYCFKISYDKSGFPELAAYDNVLFQVTDNTFKPAYYKINWKNISLESSGIKGTYLVKLMKADTIITVSAIPVFDKSNYAAALAAFDAKQKQAAAKEEKKNADEKSKLHSVDKTLSGYNHNDLSRLADRLSPFVRTFAITMLGLHNCDRPIPLSPMQIMAAGFKPESGTNEKQEPGTIYLIEKGKNTVFRFSKGEPVAFDPAAKKLMWTIDSKSRIAFFRNVDYERIARNALAVPAPVTARDQETALAEIRNFSRP